ncbi:MAG: zf-HC2 domain-containing protein [Bacteroidota bacterium]
MNRHQEVRGSLYEYLGGELSRVEREGIESHLATCPSCRHDLALLQEALALLPRPDDNPAAERPQDFWDAFPVRTIERLHRTSPTRRQQVYAHLRDSVLSFAVMRKGQIALAGAGTALAALALVLLMRPPANDAPVDVPQSQVGVIPGRVVAPPVDSAEKATQTAPVTPNLPSPSVHFASDRVSDYLRRSKILLIGIANLKEDPQAAPDMSNEGRVSRALVKEARYLKQDQKLDPRARALIEELNRVLIQLASLAERNDVSGIEIVRGGIRQENLLFKIRMAETAMDASHRTTHYRPKEVSPL